jgi:hypothetical protein
MGEAPFINGLLQSVRPPLVQKQRELPEPLQPRTPVVSSAEKAEDAAFLRRGNEKWISGVPRRVVFRRSVSRTGGDRAAGTQCNAQCLKELRPRMQPSQKGERKED